MPGFLFDCVALLMVIVIGVLLGVVGGMYIVQAIMPPCYCEQRAPAVDGEKRKLREELNEARQQVNQLRRRLGMPPKPIPGEPGNL